MNTFDQYFDAQLNVRSKEWSEEYARTMGEIDIGNSSKGPNGIKSACQTAAAHANSKLLDLEILIGSLRENTLSAVKLESERTRLAHMVQDGENAKLRQYDELVSLYNRALLNEKVRPMIEKSMSETRYYETPTALDNDIADAQHAFKAGARELNGKDEMPEELQRKIIENVKYDCAYMANDLGFSWITGTDFPGRAEDLGLKDGASAEDPRGAATRSFFLRDTGEAHGWWDDRKANMKFFEWKLEASDCVLGKPIYSEMKPEMMLTQVFPASSNPSKFNSTASITKSGTVSDSISREHSWGAKVGTSVRAKVFGASVTAFLEATYNGKYATGHVETIQNSFTVGGSSAIDLPANVSCTVTQLGFDQKCTVPYTAKYKMVPKLELSDGFVRAGGAFLKKDYFEKNKDRERVAKNFTFTHLDELRKEADDNLGPWDWHRFTQEHQDDLNDLADDSKYTFYVRGKWEGITSKRVNVQ
ncbi:hypothetical protein COL922a_012027 [Colletotrichum nupharicola]|nr:hypothetical protein COL922a_012027 [Colletotrichum nupharicola]